jgi:hypothetical protein
MKGVPIPSGPQKTGLTDTLRKMEFEDCIVVPGNLASSLHPCAGYAGVKIKTRKNKDGTINVWRIDAPVPAAPETPETLNPIGGHYVESRYGPSVFVQEEDPVVSVEETEGGRYVRTKYGPQVFYPDDPKALFVESDKPASRSIFGIEPAKPVSQSIFGPESKGPTSQSIFDPEPDPKKDIFS